MATPKDTRPGVKEVGIVVVIVAAVALIAILVGMDRHYMGPQGPTTAQIMQGHPIPAWVAKDAVQCKGDISKLSPQEQQKLNAAYPGGTARFLIVAANNMGH